MSNVMENCLKRDKYQIKISPTPPDNKLCRFRKISLNFEYLSVASTILAANPSDGLRQRAFNGVGTGR